MRIRKSAFTDSFLKKGISLIYSWLCIRDRNREAVNNSQMIIPSINYYTAPVWLAYPRVSKMNYTDFFAMKARWQ